MIGQVGNLPYDPDGLECRFDAVADLLRQFAHGQRERRQWRRRGRLFFISKFKQWHCVGHTAECIAKKWKTTGKRGQFVPEFVPGYGIFFALALMGGKSLSFPLDCFSLFFWGHEVKP
jgi:hypothetical protein